MPARRSLRFGVLIARGEAINQYFNRVESGKQIARMLAVLPNGEAVHPEQVKSVLVEPGIGLAFDSEERFDVWLQLVNADPRRIAWGLSKRDAVKLSRLCAKAINDATSASAQ